MTEIRKMEKLTRSYERWLPYLVYALLALAVLGPLLEPSYVLALDMIFVPHPDFPPAFYGISENLLTAAAVPFDMTWQLFSNIVPAWLLEKALLFFILFLAGLGAHRLLPVKGIGSYFAGLLYMINPFTYTRFLVGQWTVVAGYALAPFAIKAFIKLLEQGGKRGVIKVAVLSTLVGLVDTHWFFLLFMAFTILFLAKLIKERKQLPALKQAGKYTALSAALFIGLNIYWLVPALTASGTMLEQIGPLDIATFAPQATSNLGVVIDVASMHGFWRDAYTYGIHSFPAWWILPAFILFLSIYGLLSSFECRKAGWVAIAFALLWVISLFLALGATTDFTQPIFEWLFRNLPFFKGFRDSQKFVAFLCLAYAYLGGLGVSELVNRFRQQETKLVKAGVISLIALALLTPPVYSFTMFAFHGQLSSTKYPQEWYEINDYLNRDEGDFNILFLPWHMYMDFSWLPNTDKRLGTWSARFFDKPVFSGDNLEMPGYYSQSTNPISKYVELLLSNGSMVSNLGELLAPLNIEYVLLAHEADYASYDYLYQQADLSVALEKPGITLFQNEHPTARAYGVDSVVYINSLEEYIELSKNQDVMEHLYIFGSGQSTGNSTPMEKLSTEEKSPVGYLVGGTSRKYTIFTVSQFVNTEHWEYNSEEPLFQNLGFMPAFTSSPDGGEISYARFYHVYLPSYAMSAIAVGFMVYFYFHRSKQSAGK